MRVSSEKNLLSKYRFYLMINRKHLKFIKEKIVKIANTYGNRLTP